MKKKLLLTLLYIVGLALVVGGVFGGYYGWSQSLPHIYKNTYYAALVDKVNFLESHKNDKKIVLVGGSNVAFGFNSKLLETEFPDYKVVNFGLYAGLGTKIMMDLAKPYIGSGDMVFLLPETNAQSMSLFFSPVSTWKAIEDRKGLYDNLPSDNQKSMRGKYFSYVQEKTKFSDPIAGSGIYQRKNFNDHMDFEYLENGQSLRAQNQMSQHFDPTMAVDYSSDFFSDDFAAYSNQFASFVQSKGANLYFGFCPVDNLGAKNSDGEHLSAFYWRLRDTLNFNVVGNPKDYLIDPHYFFDSNFHLNDAGAQFRTRLLANDIYRDILGQAKESAIAIPDMPDYPDIIIGPDSESAKFFDYEENQTGYTLVKVKEEFGSLDELEIPEFINGKCFNLVAEGCFRHCSKLASLVIPKTLTAFSDGAFSNDYNLKSIKLLYEDPSKIQVSYTGSMTKGVRPGFQILVPKGGYMAYLADYYWQSYASFLVGF